MNDAGWVVVVDDGDDPLANAVHDALRESGVATLRLMGRSLARTRVEVTADDVRVRDRRVAAVLFRASTGDGLAEGFHADDASFSSSEARAAWLAALHSPSVIAVNRIDPEVWFAFADWPIWRRRLADAGVPLAPLAVGDVDTGADGAWLPWGGGVARPRPRAVRRVFGAAVTSATSLETAVVAASDVVDGADGADGEVARSVADVLASWGVSLAGLVIDEQGRVVSATATPTISEAVAPAAARRLTEVLTAHLHRR
jgi:hypothetical protein